MYTSVLSIWHYIRLFRNTLRIYMPTRLLDSLLLCSQEYATLKCENKEILRIVRCVSQPTNYNRIYIN